MTQLFVFSLPPIAEPKHEDEGEGEDNEGESGGGDKSAEPLTLNLYTEAEDLYYQTLEHYQERLYGSIESCYNLVMSSIKAGYNFEEDGYLCYWLLNKIYESFRKGKTHTYLKSGGVIYYQPLNNETPLYDLETQLKDKKEYNLINNNSKCYWLNKAINKKTNEIVYIEYSHWDEIKDTHYHVIWYKLNEIETKTDTKTDTKTINKTYWNKFIRAVGSYELEYEIVE